MCHPSRVPAWCNSGNVKHSTSIRNTSANSGNVKHPCERSEHKKCGALSMRLSFMATWLVPSHGTQTHRVCAYRFVVRDGWLIVDVPPVARVCLSPSRVMLSTCVCVCCVILSMALFVVSVCLTLHSCIFLCFTNLIKL